MSPGPPSTGFTASKSTSFRLDFALFMWSNKRITMNLPLGSKRSSAGPDKLLLFATLFLGYLLTGYAQSSAPDAASPQPRHTKRAFRVPQKLHHLPAPSAALRSRLAGTQRSTLNAQPSTLYSQPLAAASTSGAGPLAASPPISSGFLALEDDGRKTLPGTHAPVGPSHLIGSLNGQV